MQAGLNSFALIPKHWIDKTAAIGLISKAGRYGGTFAHKDIAFEFASWVSIAIHQMTNLAIECEKTSLKSERKSDSHADFGNDIHKKNCTIRKVTIKFA